MRALSPIIFTASNPDAADGEPAAKTILKILRGTDRPDWISKDNKLMVYQAEGTTEAEQALEQIEKDRFNGEVGVVTNLGIDPLPFLKARPDIYCFVECYGQAGSDPYGNIHKMRWQAKHDGWTRVVPTPGVYDNVGFSNYILWNGGITAFANGHWHNGPLAIYLAEGIGDTNSWPIINGLIQ